MSDPSEINQKLIQENALLKQKIQELETAQAASTHFEDQLRNGEESLKVSQRLAKVGSWEWTIGTQNLIMTDEAYRIHDLDPAERLPYNKFLKQIMACYRPKDRSLIQEAIRRCASSGESYDLKLPFTTAKGRNIWVRTAGEAVRYEGRFFKIVGTVMDITDYVLMEEALRQSEKQFQAVADYTPDWENWIGPDGKIRWINSMVVNFIGYTFEECLNMPDYPMTIVDEPDRERIRQLFMESIHGSTGSADCRLICKGGQRKWGEVTWRPMYDEAGCFLGSRSSLRDITSRKQMEDALRHSEYIQRSILQVAPIGIALASNRIIKRVNQRLCEMTGYTSEELINISTRMLYPTEAEYESVGRELEVVSSWGTGSIESRWVCKDGTIINVLINLPHLRSEIENEESIFTVLDITARKQAEEELENHRKDLERLVKKRTSELENKSKNLEELNVALKVLLQQREKDRDEVEAQVLANVKELVMPYIQKLKIRLGNKGGSDYVNILESNLTNIISPFSNKLSSKYLNLTSREIQIANLIKEGKTTKDCAQLLHISPGTVTFHRKNIRTKLKLQNKKSNLRSYLLTLS